jgi:transposase
MALLPPCQDGVMSVGGGLRMSLRSPLGSSLPEETARVARAAFPAGAPSLRMRVEAAGIFAGEGCAPLYPERGPAAAPWRWSRSSRLRWTAPIDKPPTPCAPASTGRMPSRAAPTPFLARAA